ncbi:hypothetical protein BVE84_01630 [Streptococcus azizii]|uniref:YiaAB two helix domain-containing protein n=2 Tax=Streptococcus TaxID=1301 RepID=A0AB36JTM4_9STRE|nr:hypothetical protein BVE86_00320 [Streptococcus azizii]ONK30014.1 hypothetical protein BVE85_01630 [Streptococcus azizii]ONK30930.1 hypothetical protein BVE84_01630 [Streptococcus azizii]
MVKNKRRTPMNKVKKKIYRNTPAFTLMAWASFAFFVALILIGLYTLKEPLMVKGYYLMGSVGLISSSFTVSKVVRDNQEDEDNYNLLLQKATIKEEADK